MSLNDSELVQVGPPRRGGHSTPGLHSCRLLPPKLLAGLGLLIGLAGTVQTYGTDNQLLSSVVLRVKGQAELSADGKRWRALKPGEVLLPGLVIKTATNSLVDLWLGGKPDPAQQPTRASRRQFYVPETRYLLRVLEASMVGIDRVAGEPMTGRTNRVKEIQLDLRAGSIAGSFAKGAGEAQGIIKFTNGLSRVQHGLFTLSASGAIEVWRGKAVISVTGRSSSREVIGAHRFDPLTDVVTELPDAGHLHPPAVSVELPQAQPLGRGPQPPRKF